MSDSDLYAQANIIIISRLTNIPVKTVDEIINLPMNELEKCTKLVECLVKRDCIISKEAATIIVNAENIIDQIAEKDGIATH